MEGFVERRRNLNPGTTITIGLDDKDGNPGDDTPGTGTIVDIVDPIWKVNNIEINENLANLKNSTVTLELTATDKYYLSNVFEEARATGTLDEALRNNILLYIDRENLLTSEFPGAILLHGKRGEHSMEKGEAASA